MKDIDSLESVSDMDKLIKAFEHSKKGVMWKPSVQKFLMNLPKNILELHNKLINGIKVGHGFYNFEIHERGKPRDIQSVNIEERVAQRSVCDNALIPALTRPLIYDNGASLKGKGISFAFRRIRQHLAYHFRRYGKEGYALLFDFSSYFSNLDHTEIKKLIDKTFNCDELKQLIMGFIYAFTEGGLGLGSEVSQIIAIAYPNTVIDHYIKEVLRIKCYGRYMDDLYIIHPSKEYLQKCLDIIIERAHSVGIVINKKKTRIVPLKNGVPFLKTLFLLTDTGKIIMKPSREAVVRQRRKLKKFKQFYLDGEMSLAQIKQSYNSWRGYIKHKDARKSINSMDKLARRLFGVNLHSEKKKKKSYGPEVPQKSYTKNETALIKSQMRLDSITMLLHRTKPNTKEHNKLLKEQAYLKEKIRRLEDQAPKVSLSMAGLKEIETRRRMGDKSIIQVTGPTIEEMKADLKWCQERNAYIEKQLTLNIPEKEKVKLAIEQGDLGNRIRSLISLIKMEDDEYDDTNLNREEFGDFKDTKEPPEPTSYLDSKYYQ